MTAQPSLLWSGEVRHPEPGSRGQWRVVLIEGNWFNGRYHESGLRLVIERAIERSALGEPVWQYAAALPSDVLLELLLGEHPEQIDERVRTLLAEGLA